MDIKTLKERAARLQAFLLNQPQVGRALSRGDLIACEQAVQAAQGLETEGTFNPFRTTVDIEIGGTEGVSDLKVSLRRDALDNPAKWIQGVEPGSVVYLCGAPGSGKSLRVSQALALLNCAGRMATVLEVGGAYEQLSQEPGCSALMVDEALTDPRDFAEASVLSVDFESWALTSRTFGETNLPVMGEWSDFVDAVRCRLRYKSILVLDELPFFLSFFAKDYTPLIALIQEARAAGVVTVLVGQRASDIEKLAAQMGVRDGVELVRSNALAPH